MAKRSRRRRRDIPGYDESRPTREERKKQHRAARHAANQVLHTIEDPDEIVLPQERRTRTHETGNGEPGPAKRRYRVWKTKFWKRRYDYRDEKAALDSVWPVVTPNQLPEK